MNREEWLTAAAEAMKDRFDEEGFPLGDFAVSVGFPSIRGTSARNRRIGECWHPSAGGGTSQVFISPILSDRWEILGTLAHELAHVATPGEGHKGPFVRLIRALDLEGKPTATTVGERFKDWVDPLTRHLPEFPHKPLNAVKMDRPKQSTRMLKAICEDDGYTVRLSRKWLDEGGPPICPICRDDMTEEL